MKILAFLLLPFLTGCHVYGAFAVHDKSLDSEFKQERLIATVGGEQALNDNFSVYIEHSSQPTYKEDGWGLNTAGIRGKAKLF